MFTCYVNVKTQWCYMQRLMCSYVFSRYRSCWGFAIQLNLKVGLRVFARTPPSFVHAQCWKLIRHQYRFSKNVFEHSEETTKTIPTSRTASFYTWAHCSGPRNLLQVLKHDHRWPNSSSTFVQTTVVCFLRTSEKLLWRLQLPGWVARLQTM